MQTDHELKEQAVSVLDVLYPEIENGFYQAGMHEQHMLDAVRADIEQMKSRILDDRAVVNPSFTKAAELGAEFVFFSYYHADEFAAMFNASAVGWHRKINIRTATGFGHLCTFYRSVCDDHDYCVDTSTDRPLLKSLAQSAGGTRSFSPNTLLKVLQDYRQKLPSINHIL